MPGPGTVSRVDRKLNVNIARLEKGGERFELDIEPDLAIRYRNGENIDIRTILKAEKIFSDTKKGLLASEAKMESLFNTNNVLEIAEKILKQGEIQLTAEYRNKLMEDRRKRILNMIHTNGVDPKTGFPHPLQRLENAFTEANVKISEHEPIEREVKRIIKELMPILPIKFETRLIELRIPGNYAPKTYRIIKQTATIKQESWANDGSWVGQIEIPAGLQEDLFDKLNSMTHGGLQSRIIDKR